MRKFAFAVICLFITGLLPVCSQDIGIRQQLRGSSSIAAGYGIGNAWKALFNFTVPSNGGKYDVTSSGPYSLIYEYGFSNRITAGIALGYSTIKGIYTYQSSTVFYRNTEKLTVFSALARGNYHFGKFQKFDPFVGFGLGYLDVNYESRDNTGSATPGTGVRVPGQFGFSGILGGKYYLHRNLGIFTELGYVAGAYAQAGLTARF